MLGPRGLALTKRQAVALAYSVSVSKRAKLVVSFVDTTSVSGLGHNVALTTMRGGMGVMFDNASASFPK
jgi:hypothetical protein